MPKLPPGPAAKALLANPDAFGTALLVLCLDAFGPECLHDPDDPDRGPWHPTTFRAELERHFGATLAEGNLARLVAAVTVVTTDLFWKNAAAFVTLANILAGDDFNPGVWDKADSAECAWAVTEALLLDPPDKDDPEPFSAEVRHYIGAVLRDEGYVTPPDVLRVALGADFAGKVRYEYADDPQMFEAVYSTQQAKTAEIEEVLRDQLLALREQLLSLPLGEGDVSELAGRIAGLLKLNEPDPAPPGPQDLV